MNSSDNPADLASRGLKVNSFLKNQIWVSGPPFLVQPQELWPMDSTDVGVMSSCDPEVKESVLVNTVQVHQEYDFMPYFNYYSSWMRLKRGIAWILRFRNILIDLRKERKRLMTVYSNLDKLQQETVINQEMQKIRSNVSSNLLSSEELERSELEIIHLCQKKRYSEELASLRKDGLVKRSSELFRLNPVLHSDIIRVGGRLDKAMMPEEVKHLVILAKDLHISDLILRQIHNDIGHCGRNYMLANLRQRYWIPGVSTAIRRILSKCVVCRRLHGTMGYQQMADLPQDSHT